MGFVGEKYLAEELTYDCYIYSKTLTEKNIPWNNRNLQLSGQSALEKINNERKEAIYREYEKNYLK